MGCDIHLFIEVKTIRGWLCYSHPSVSREYAIFAKMANVRNYDNVVEPISVLKGIPEDASFITKRAFEDAGKYQHHASYLTHKEICKLSNWMQLNTHPQNFDFGDLEREFLHTYLNGNSFCGFEKGASGYPKWIEDVRFVFWFDS